MKDKIRDIEEVDLVEMDFLEKVAIRLPEDKEVLLALGDIYTRIGRYEDGLKTDRTLVRLAPDDATIRYNLACSLALLKRREDALETLQKAVELGYQDNEWMSRDRDLVSLRGEKAFQVLLEAISSSKSVKSVDS
ncbi:MAG: tetratricopeptide repeat protein [bacterium]